MQSWLLDKITYDNVQIGTGEFLAIFFEAMPFIVLGSIVAGFVEEFIPQGAIARFIPRSKLRAICASALLGLIFPMCECGIIVVMRRLLRKGLPVSSCVAYMLAGPIINVVVIASTYVAFFRFPEGYWIIGARVVFGYLVAVNTALIVDWQYRKHGDRLLVSIHPPGKPVANTDQDEGAVVERKPLLQRMGSITETALHDFLDITLFLILGALLAAIVGRLVSKDELSSLSMTYPVLSIVIMMGMAVLLCLCSEADAFVAASFTNLNPAAKIAFLVLGPMMDIKLFLMYTRVFRFRLIWTIVISVVVQVLIYSLLAFYLLRGKFP